jgi:hypothetical protein
MTEFKDNILTDFHAQLICCKTQESFDDAVLNFLVYKMEYNRKYNINSIFTEKQKNWREKLKASICKFAGMKSIFSYWEVNSDYLNSKDFIFRKLQK